MDRRQIKGSARIVLVVGPSEEYTSMYGYPKRRYSALAWRQLGPDSFERASQFDVTDIKREPCPDIYDDGEGIGTTSEAFVYYCKNAGRKQGEPRFFNRIDRMLQAYGMVATDETDAQAPDFEVLEEALEEFNGAPFPEQAAEAAFVAADVVAIDAPFGVDVTKFTGRRRAFLERTLAGFKGHVSSLKATIDDLTLDEQENGEGAKVAAE